MYRKCSVCAGKGYLWQDAMARQVDCWRCLGRKIVNDQETGTEEET